MIKNNEKKVGKMFGMYLKYVLPLHPQTRGEALGCEDKKEFFENNYIRPKGSTRLLNENRQVLDQR